MIASNKELANILFPFPSNLQSSQQISFSTKQMNIDIDKTRGQSKLSSSNSFRELSVYSKILSMDYMDKVQALANN